MHLIFEVRSFNRFVAISQLSLVIPPCSRVLTMVTTIVGEETASSA